jgi:hypothetical protein
MLSGRKVLLIFSAVGLFFAAALAAAKVICSVTGFDDDL